MPISLTSLGTASYGLGAGAFLVLLLLLLLHWRGRLQGTLLLAASLISVAWAGSIAVHLGVQALRTEVVIGLEVLRSLAWIAFLAAMLPVGASGRLRVGWVGKIGAAAILLGVVAVAMSGMRLTTMQPGSLTLPGLFGLALSVLGILLTETLHRNTSSDFVWRMKFLSLSMGAIFAYDLFLYADAMLFGETDPTLILARGAVQALAVPLLAVAAARNEMWRTNIALSRKLVVHSTALIASGAYLVLMAGGGYLLREIDETRGPVFQVIFLVGAVAVLAISLLSGTSWAYLKQWVSRHFFQSKYDWRAEWLRFMDTLSVGRAHSLLEERAIKALADILESPGGGMWLLEDEGFVQVSRWNFPELKYGEPCEGNLVQFLRKSRRIVDLREAMADPEEYPGLIVPEELVGRREAWLVVPLWHHELVGFVVLARPRTPRSLGWEDFDLIHIVGRQIASYLSERKATQALGEAREFEIFNRRFAFVVHDIKNLVSQLSLISGNIERHGDKKAFRDDLAKSLDDAAARMKRLMARLDMPQSGPVIDEVTLVDELVEDVVAARAKDFPSVEVRLDAEDLAVLGDRDRLAAVVDHLLQNAIEAVAADGTVQVALRRNGRYAVLDIVDDGPGMDRDFIRNELFKPFRSTKAGGMGIGVYQCREYASELGGNLEVSSEPGKGTSMRVTLPLSDVPAAGAPALSESP